MEENNLIKLADEYAENIKLLVLAIAQCRESIKQASKSNRKMTVSKLKANLAEMYRNRRELSETEKHLRYYHSDEEDKKAG